MTPGVAPLSIAVAALVTQFGLLVILLVGLVILRQGEPRQSRYSERPGHVVHNFIWLLAILMFATLGPLILSDAFAETGRPLFQDLVLPSVKSSYALASMFYADLFGVALLIGRTGGSRGSPFATLLFMLPAIAIFLREPFSSVVGYAVVASVLYTIGLFRFQALYKGMRDDGRSSEGVGTLCHWAVNVSALLLAVAIGYATRPR